MEVKFNRMTSLFLVFVVFFVNFIAATDVKAAASSSVPANVKACVGIENGLEKEGNQIKIGGVSFLSPAWLAGLRKGDILREVIKLKLNEKGEFIEENGDTSVAGKKKEVVLGMFCGKEGEFVKLKFRRGKQDYETGALKFPGIVKIGGGNGIGDFVLKNDYLAFPVNYNCFGCFISKQRYNRGKQNVKPHLALDIMSIKDKNKVACFAAADGTAVVATNNTKGFTDYGKTVVIDSIITTESGESFRFGTLYAHLKEILVKPGDIVKKGQTIGYIGNSGCNPDVKPHLHFEIRINIPDQTNPYKGLKAKTLDENYRPEPPFLVLG